MVTIRKKEDGDAPKKEVVARAGNTTIRKRNEAGYQPEQNAVGKAGTVTIRRKAEAAPQAQEVMAPRKANLLDLTVGSVKRGYTASQKGQEAYKQMMGKENELEKYTDKMDSDEFNFQAEGALARGVSGAAEMLGQQVRQWTDKRSLTAAGGAAALAAAAGQAGPQVLVPEEIFTVPVAFATGMKAGSTLSNFEIEAGNAYLEMRENGISEDTAKKVALVVGGGNAALEAVQLDELFKSFKVLDKLGVGDTAVDKVKKVLMDRGVDVAKETAQEVAQEGVTVAGSQAASKMEKGEWQYGAEEVGKRLGDTALASALTFGVMNVPGGVRNVSAALRNQNTTKQPAAETQQAETERTVPVAEHIGAQVEQKGREAEQDEPLRGLSLPTLEDEVEQKAPVKGLSLPTLEDTERQERMARATTELERTGIQYGVSDENIQAAERISEATGRKIVFFAEDKLEGLDMNNGYYDSETGMIWVNAKSKNPMAQIISHELTHSTELAESYKQLSGLVLTKLSREGKDIDQLRREKAERYARNGVELEDLAAVDKEIVAEYVEKHLLTDEKSILELTQQDRNLAQKILDWINGMLAKLEVRKAQERDFLLKARTAYAKALGESTTAGKSRAEIWQRQERLRQAYADGEMSEAEFDAAWDGVEAAESQLGAPVLKEYGSKEQYSIETLENGKKYVRADRQVIFGNDPDAWSEQLEDYINGKIRNGENVQLTTDDGDVLTLTEDTAGKIASYYENGRTMSDEAYERKVNAGAHIDELALASTRGSDKPTVDYNARHGSMASGGWDYRTAFFRDFDGKYYQCTISVSKGKDGNVVYNIGKMKERRFPHARNALSGSSAESGALRGETSSVNSLHDRKENVNAEREEIPGLSLPPLEDDTRGRQYSIGEDEVPGLTLPKVEESTHEVLAMENGAAPFKTGTSSQRGLPGGDAPSVLSLLQQVKDVNEKLGEEMGEAEEVKGLSLPSLEDESRIQHSISEDEVPGLTLPKVEERRDDEMVEVKPLTLPRVEAAREKVSGDNDAREKKRGGSVEDEIVKQAHDAGYPVLKGEQIVPFKTWVHATDMILHKGQVVLDKHGEPKRWNNYGVVVGKGSKEHTLTVAFWNKHFQDDQTGEDLRSKREIAYNDLTPVPGVYQMTKEELEALLDSEPESAEESALTEMDREEIEELLERGTQGRETIWKKLPSVNIESLTKREMNRLEQAERSMVKDLGNRLNVPKKAQRKYLYEIAREISEEYFREGKVAQKKLDRLFDTAFKNGIVEADEFYRRYKHVEDYLSAQVITVSEQGKRDISDFESFCKSAAGTLNIAEGDGVSVDEAYRDLNEMEPELFPEDITHPSDQLLRMYDVGGDIRNTKCSLEQYYGPEATTIKSWMRNDFEIGVMDNIGKLFLVKRYAADRQEAKQEQDAAKAKEAEQIPSTTQEAMQLHQQMKDARRTYEKTAAKNLLTNEDEIKVGRLLRGEITVESLDARTDNVRGITAVYEARKEYDRLAKLLARYKSHLRQKAREKADSYLATSGAWEDKRAGILYSRETMERNIRDIVKDKNLADEIIQEYFAPVHDSQAEATRGKNRYRQRVQQMDLSRKVTEGNEVSEAHAVQLLGEAEDNIRMLENSRGRMKHRDGKTLSEWKDVVADLWKNNPNLDRAKINGAIREFRVIYDELFQQMNEVRVRNGYEPVNYRNGYFPHFQPGNGDGILSQFGKALGIDTQVVALPTTINGITHTFKPGITWFGNTQQRLGFATAYDAVEGFDKYIEGVMDVIHHTDNIQNLRAFANQIRYRSSDKGIQEQVDAVKANSGLTEQQKDNEIDRIYAEAKFTLGNFVVELDEYTNLLANKKSHFDRNMERFMGRGFYSFMKAMESRLGANMVGGNVSSWLTNFIPITQGGAMLDREMVLRGLWDTLRSFKEDDGIIDRSSFLTNRKGSDPIVKTWTERVSDKVNWSMERIDSITAGTLVRGRYYQNLKNKMSETEAMRDADAWAASVIGDRSKGATPTLFQQKNPLTKIFTQFQLEVNNQLSFLFKDMPREAGERGKKALAEMLLRFFLGAWLYNEVYELFFGRRPALDPIGILNDTVGDLTGYELPNLVEFIKDDVFGDGISREDFQTEKKGRYEALSGMATSAVEELPFIGGVLGGGRVPISSAFPDLENLAKAAVSENWSREKKVATTAKELVNPLLYLLPPTGGGQVKKMVQGLMAVHDRGSYSVNAEGEDELQYPVFADNPLEAAVTAGRAAVFGKSSLPEAVDWVESGFKRLTADETAVYRNLMEDGMSGRDTYELISELKSITGKGANLKKLAHLADVQMSNYAVKQVAGLIHGTDMKTESGGMTNYAKLLAAMDTGLEASECLRMQAQEIDLGKYLEFESAGVNVYSASQLTKRLAALKPEKGYEKVTNRQQYKAIADVKLSDEESLKAFSVVMGDSEYARVSIGYDFGLSPSIYAEAKYAMPDYDADENGTIKQEEATMAIRAVEGIGNAERAVLWQIQNKAWSEKKNPFSVRIGRAVKAALNELEEDDEVKPLSLPVP